jgi:hypothetical protein
LANFLLSSQKQYNSGSFDLHLKGGDIDMSQNAGSIGLRSFVARVATSLAALGAVSLYAAALVSPALALPGQIPLVSNLGTLAADRNQVIRVMIVGDSITQGLEGDWTWRYRIWQWFKEEGVEVCVISILISLC